MQTKKQKKKREKDNKLIQEIYVKFLTNEVRWEERLKAIEEIQKIKYEERLAAKSKIVENNPSSTFQEGTHNKILEEGEEEEEQHNGGYGRPEIMNEMQHSQIVSPSKDTYSFVCKQKNS